MVMVMKITDVRKMKDSRENAVRANKMLIPTNIGTDTFLLRNSKMDSAFSLSDLYADWDIPFILID